MKTWEEGKISSRTRTKERETTTFTSRPRILLQKKTIKSWPCARKTSRTQDQSYVDLVRQHVNNYIAAAQHWVKESNLTRKVREWQERILPILELQKGVRAFDVQVCRCSFDSHVFNLTRAYILGLAILYYT